MAAGRRLLLLEVEDSNAGETEEPHQLGYNEKYAQRFTHNKKREDLQRFQMLQKKGLAGGASDNDDDDDESSSEEEDDDGLLPARTEEKIVETLSKIKKRDPIIYSSDTKFFGDDNDEDEEEERKMNEAKLKKHRPLYLKDVNARQLLEGGEGEDGEDEIRKPKKPLTSYLNEQEELKRAFLQGVREAEGGGEDVDYLLRVKKTTKEELECEAREVEEAVEDAEQRAKDKNITKRLEEYFGKHDELDDNDKFLKEYLLNKGWIDVDQKQLTYPTYNDYTEDISEDEEALDKQDQFEKYYNFRYQDGVDNTYVKGHSRTVDDSVRKKSETRKKEREKKRERESEEAQARREELKRLKNVKKKEVLEKLAKIRAVAGIGATSNSSNLEVLGTDDLDEDFDPDEYDKKMKEAFGEEYYGTEDPDFVDGEDEFSDIEKPNFYAEDELLGIGPEGGDLLRSAATGFAAVKAKLASSTSPEVEGKKEKKKKKKKKLKVPFEEKLLIDKHLEEYYKLDYEDVVGDLPTRFKYRPVKPNKYGLRTKDIMGLDAKELNQYVSIKKLAPYTTEEWEPRRPAPRFSSKARRKKALNFEEDTPRKKSNSVAAHEAVNTEETPEKTSSAIVVDNTGVSTENVSSTEHANGEHVPGENGLGSGAAFEDKKKKTRKRKKSGDASSPLPISRLLSYAPQSGKKMVEGRSERKKVKRR